MAPTWRDAAELCHYYPMAQMESTTGGAIQADWLAHRMLADSDPLLPVIAYCLAVGVCC